MFDQDHLKEPARQHIHTAISMCGRPPLFRKKDFDTAKSLKCGLFGTVSKSLLLYDIRTNHFGSGALFVEKLVREYPVIGFGRSELRLFWIANNICGQFRFASRLSFFF